MRFVSSAVLACVIASVSPGCFPDSPGVKGFPPIGEFENALKVCPSGPTVPGVDVSKWQGAIDWKKVAGAGIAFAITRIGHGNAADEYFQTNWKEIKANGMVRGGYLFYEPLDAIDAQAKLVIDSVGMLGPGDLPVTLDVEWTDGEPDAADIQTWVDKVTAGTGKRPMIYTAVGYWDQYFDGEFGDLDLWVANWDVSCPSIPSSWKGWLFWQTTGGGGNVPGIKGGVDTDVFNGKLEDLKLVAGLPPDTFCSASQSLACAQFGCACADDKCGGAFCEGTGCSKKRAADCAGYGCQCVDGDCNGGFCDGPGCTVKETNDCAAYGCPCADHECSGGYCDGSGCTAKEETTCAGAGCACVDHKCSGGICGGTGCTAKQATACQAQGADCANGKCLLPPPDAVEIPDIPEAVAVEDIPEAIGPEDVAAKEPAPEVVEDSAQPDLPGEATQDDTAETTALPEVDSGVVETIDTHNPPDVQVTPDAGLPDSPPVLLDAGSDPGRRGGGGGCAAGDGGMGGAWLIGVMMVALGILWRERIRPSFDSRDRLRGFYTQVT